MQAMEHFDLLADVSTMTLATRGAQGEPHACAVYFAADDKNRLYFFSDPQSQHGQDLAGDPRSAVSIYPECLHWREIRGIQMRGLASQVPPGAAWEAGWESFKAKFPFVAELEEVVAGNVLYVFAPQWIRLVDNRLGFGYKQEWYLEKSPRRMPSPGSPRSGTR